MKLTSSNEVLAENKVLILYILNVINTPVTESDLLKLVLSIIDMNYFYFQQFIIDLVEKNYIIKYEKDNFNFIELTTDGKKALSLTNNILPGIIKLKIDENIKPTQKKIQNEISISSDFEPIDNNNYYVSCKIIENNRIIFDIKVLANSRETAKKISENWKKNADIIYPEILKKLIE